MARLEQYRREMAYRVYVCDSLYLRAENKYIATRYSDIIFPPPEETRTGEEVIAHIKDELKGLMTYQFT